MLENFWWLMNTIREELLEKFILPGIGISYWKFLIYLAVAGVVITVLINSVRYSVSGHSDKDSKDSKDDKKVTGPTKDEIYNMTARGGGKPPPMGMR